ncbi:MAG: hypothetical protein ACLFRR_07775 [Spirochaetaceae bacterium]
MTEPFTRPRIHPHVAPQRQVTERDGMMKSTGELSVLADYSFDEKTINIHPNDGYELGLMTTRAVVRIFAGCTMGEFLAGEGRHVFGNLNLRNETKVGTVELSLRTADRMGRPKRARLLHIDDDGEQYGKLFIQPL